MYERLLDQREEFNKGRRQMSIWMSTANIIDILSKYLDMSKTEVVHLAVKEMKMHYIQDSEGKME